MSGRVSVDRGADPAPRYGDLWRPGWQAVSGAPHGRGQGLVLQDGLRKSDIGAPCEEKEAIAAVFDLTGFTNFCNQVDSYLAIPKFLNDFLDWFFNRIKMGLTELDDNNHNTFWADFPTMVKFLGDGLLLVWNARGMTEEQICRIVGTLYEICRDYRREFYPQMSMAVNKPPSILRCGIARGKVFSIGNGSDFVGHCINNASRLSRISSLSFCFPHRGFQVQEHMPPEYRQQFVPKYVSIRGVGDNELVWVGKEEFERLVKKFPRDDYAKRARKNIRECLIFLAEYELHVGHYYYKKGNYKAALGRFTYLIKNYPDMGQYNEALEYISLCKEKLAEETGPQ